MLNCWKNVSLPVLLDHSAMKASPVTRVMGNKAMKASPVIKGILNNKPFAGIYDCDDLFGTVLEVMIQGQYCWVANVFGGVAVYCTLEAKYSVCDSGA